LQIIKIHHPMNVNDIYNQDKIVLAMGYFDGVHLGHQSVINRAKEIATEKGLDLAILTYDHQPDLVYKQLTEHQRRNIIMNDDKMQIFKHLGVQKVFLINYSFKFQDQTPQEFVDNYLVQLNVDTVVAGADHTYGSNNADMNYLPEYAKGRFNVEVVNLKQFDNLKISSSRIRRNLDDGHIETVNKMLGRPFFTSGTVIHGYARGRELGYPTANIEHDELQWLPSIGVYVVEVTIGNRKFKGMASIGRNVTFGDKNPITVEINILDFNDNIYGEVIGVNWLYRIRGEVKFTGIEGLVAQLRDDEGFTRKFFKK
jgi:riboflavin kinase / FMN adenylyltransferase